MANEVIYYLSNGNANLGYEYVDWAYFSGMCACGFNKGGIPGDRFINGAIRIPNVPLDRNQGFQDAGIFFQAGRTGESIYFTIRGINRDNCDELTNNPFGWEQTSESSGQYIYQFNDGSILNFGLGGIIRQIIGRSGWNRNNAMGFTFRSNPETNHGNQSNYFITSLLGSYKIGLWIRFDGEPTWKPTPQSVAAPTFPDPKLFGVRISKADVDVRVATRADLLYDSDLSSLRIVQQGKVSVTGGVNTYIAHGLGFKPLAIAYVKSTAGAGRFKIPRYFPAIQQDPYDDNINASISVTSNNVIINATANADVYYYIFIDELS